ncbi:DNRLRE domain-containing protein [Cerasicoccus maritimus]|uniref:DNRLRE domain-containing protein n=1 Tax=Cerasicoccus maritimus TaxID=490089 RepID=UPI002852CF77|nr:DNRLRE domain-containing protein [Cerasicoccus maritimus]
MNTTPVILSSLLVASVAFADSLSFTPSQDASIMSNDTSVSVGDLFGGFNSSGQERRPLLQFDLSSIPTGSTINSVSLTLNAAQMRGTQTFGLHALTTAWTEGTNTGSGGQGGIGTAPTPANSVAWASPWSTPGGDFGVELDSVFVNSTGDVVFSTGSLLSAVQGWVDLPSSNLGFILVGANGAPQNAVRFGSREEGVAPVLDVDFTVVPEPRFYALTAAALCLAMVIIRRRAIRSA